MGYYKEFFKLLGLGILFTIILDILISGRAGEDNFIFGMLAAVLCKISDMASTEKEDK